jgi:hypothetical protein
MSTYFFKTGSSSNEAEAHIKPHLDRLEDSKEIERWKVHQQDEVLEIETHKMSPEQVKHYLREAGVDVEFTRPPAGESRR